MAVKRSVEGLRRNAQRKRQEAFEKVERGIQKLIREKQPINFNAVAEASGVSKAWLYKQPEIKERIEHLRSQSTGKKQIPPRQRASDASLKAMVQTLKARIQRLEAENRDLRQQNQVAYGQILRLREVEQQSKRLEAENSRLRSQTTDSSQPSHTELAELGVEMNSTLERLINETPEGIVATAIESLREAVTTGNVQNPGGFLNRAIRDAWKPSDTSAIAETDLGRFNEWWKLAHRKGLVIAATQKDEARYVYTANEEWVSFEAMLENYPIKSISDRFS
jgi:hypothetical protein